jgi:Uma2 family endonuclease
MTGVRADFVSYADLQRMPDDGRQYELYDGDVRVVPSPTNRHQLVLHNLFALLLQHEQKSGGRLLSAPSDVVFSEYNVIQPDLLYFTKARRHLVRMDTPTRAAPDLTVEVISPGTSAHDRGRKQALCARFGVRESWVVDPFDETIEIYLLEGPAYRLTHAAGVSDVAISPTLGGLRVSARRIFDID